jgi:hypothetical protein
MDVTAEAERMAADYGSALDASVVSRPKTREYNAEAGLLAARAAELRRTAEEAAAQQGAARRGAEEAAARLAELRRVFSLVERIAAHVQRVDAAVAAMEAAVAERTRQQTVTSIRSALSPVSRLFGGGAAAAPAAAPFVRPPASLFDAHVL